METIMKADVFFFVSTIGFVVLVLLGVVAVYYLIRLLRTLVRIMEALESGVDKVREEAQFLLEDLRTSPIFRLFIGRPRKRPVQQKQEE